MLTGWGARLSFLILGRRKQQVGLCPNGLRDIPLANLEDFRKESRYEARVADVFAGDSGTDCDFAVVCVSGAGR